MTETVAALDAGTNTRRLYVARVDDSAGGHPALRELERELRFVGLGHGVDATGRLDDEAIDRAWSAIGSFMSSPSTRIVRKAVIEPWSAQPSCSSKTARVSPTFAVASRWARAITWCTGPSLRRAQSG